MNKVARRGSTKGLLKLTPDNFLEICNALDPIDAISLRSNCKDTREKINKDLLARQFCSRHWPNTLQDQDVDWCKRYSVLSRNGKPTKTATEPPSSWIENYIFSCSMKTLDGKLFATSTTVEVAEKRKPENMEEREFRRKYKTGIPVEFTVTFPAGVSIPCIEKWDGTTGQEQMQNFQYVVYVCQNAICQNANTGSATKSWAHLVTFSDIIYKDDDEEETIQSIGSNCSTSLVGIGKLHRNRNRGRYMYRHPMWIGLVNQKPKKAGHAHASELCVSLKHIGTLELGPDPAPPTLCCVRHIIGMRKKRETALISRGRGRLMFPDHNIFEYETVTNLFRAEDKKMTTAFHAALSESLSLQESNIVDIHASDHRSRSSYAKGPTRHFCKVNYCVHVSSEKEMEEMEQKITEMTRNITVFTNALKNSMIVNTVSGADSISVSETSVPWSDPELPDDNERKNKWKLNKTTFELSIKGDNYIYQHNNNYQHNMFGEEGENYHVGCWKAPMTMVGLRSVLKCLEWV
tara:strand:+ start:1 stop:1557 length:1557 start_codon:yes stop_codon:yes gene_type:complete